MSFIRRIAYGLRRATSTRHCWHAVERDPERYRCCYCGGILEIPHGRHRPSNDPAGAPSRDDGNCGAHQDPAGFITYPKPAPVRLSSVEIEDA